MTINWDYLWGVIAGFSLGIAVLNWWYRRTLNRRVKILDAAHSEFRDGCLNQLEEHRQWSRDSVVTLMRQHDPVGFAHCKTFEDIQTELTIRDARAWSKRRGKA